MESERKRRSEGCVGGGCEDSGARNHQRLCLRPIADFAWASSGLLPVSMEYSSSDIDKRSLIGTSTLEFA